ncbi:DEKNAAC100091 [Brettanomyces naardenensis]|uniref:ER membrane protein complex subunit 2 n=1 Tax=Brettanomyces naardenensis TaxID=13370 RepID=A0A448YFJ4_BRENA|nr:DEKNAAC100091 [Brettanomyces naardenensis]
MSLDVRQQLLNYSLSRRHLSLPPEHLASLYEVCTQFVGSPSNFGQLDKIEQNSVLLLQLQLSLLTCHDIEAKAILEKLTDLVNDDRLVSSESQWLIYWRSVYLQCQSENGNIEKGDLPTDPIFEYLNQASAKFIKDSNRRIGTSLGATGDPARLRSPEDLYMLKKRKAALFSYGKDNRKYAEKLLELIDLRPLDLENWCELAEVYLASGELEKCHCCYLEVLIGVPFAYNIWARLGEVCLLLDRVARDGGNGKKGSSRDSGEQLKNAVRHFSRSIELCDMYARGWSGLYVALKRLLVTGEKVGEAYSQLQDIAERKLRQMVLEKQTNESEITNIKWILERET